MGGKPRRVIFAPPTAPALTDLAPIIDQARRVAASYYRLTGKPLGITGEVGEFEAARILGMELAPAREEGFDAVDRSGERIQIKSRVLRRPGAGRLGAIKLEKPWDAVVLVLMDHEFQPTEIYKAGRAAIAQALSKPGSRARNQRGQLSVSKFRSIGTKVWPSSAD